MSSKTKPENLTTRGQAKNILARIRPAFREHIRPHTKDGKGEQLGGGSILNARWHHRLSRDLDVHLQLSTMEDARALLDRAAAAAGGYRIEHPRFPRIEFERNKDNHVDVSVSAPKPGHDEKTAIVDGEETIVLSTAQIMTGKLGGRGPRAPVRDLVDIAVCRIADPEALEVAVNSLDEETLNGILKIYKETRKVYEQATEELEDVPATLQPVVANPTAYATNAILESKYQRFEIHTRNGAARIQTTTIDGTRTRSYTTAEELRDGMERDGINSFLTAQQRDKDAVLNTTIDAIWARRDTKILRINPERLQHGKRLTRELTWTPPQDRTRCDDRDKPSGAVAPDGPTLDPLPQTVNPPSPPAPAAGSADAQDRDDNPSRGR